MVAILPVQDEPDRFTEQWWADVLLGNPLKLAGLVLLAVVTRFVLHRLIDRLVARAAQVSSVAKLRMPASASDPARAPCHLAPNA